MWVYIKCFYIYKYYKCYNFYLHLYGKMFSLLFPLSWMDYFILWCKCLNSSYCSIFGSESYWLSREVNHSFKACDWLLITDVTHSCAHAPLAQDQAWVDRESWWSASWYQQSWIGLVLFCQLQTNPVTLSLFSHHHGTGPWFLELVCLQASVSLAVYVSRTVRAQRTERCWPVWPPALRTPNPQTKKLPSRSTCGASWLWRTSSH